MAEVDEDVLRELYSVPPDDFMQKRGELVDAARKDGDAKAATAIGKLRKPTVAAWIVNVLVLRDPSVVEKLAALGEQLRAAQDALDAARLRDLSTERRNLVGKLCSEAFKIADRADPPAALRDEVSGTFDAAIADADVAGRLGHLQRAEQWSGFGFPPTAAPELTLVRGGRDDAAEKKQQTGKPKLSPAERRKQQRTLTQARNAFEAADREHEDAKHSEHELSQQVRQLIKKLGKLQDQLDSARAELEAARKEVSSTREARRSARSALDRAERDASR